jgi:CDP-4-dehydro-6-deoxyglucose reductase, E1
MRRFWPLMENNITKEDLDAIIAFLKGNPILTQSNHVRAFEREWSDWLGVKHSVFVNSGASANILTLAAVKEAFGGGEVIVAPLGWISDIVAVILNAFEPIFVDINPRNLAMDTDLIIDRISHRTRAVLLTHVQGFCGLSEQLLEVLEQRNILLIEDTCESHGATFRGRKLGTFGAISNFSFYYAHHMSTIEGGMVSTDSDELFEIVRMLRSHGMVREATDDALKARYEAEYPDLNPDFIFAYPGFNMRNTEIGAVLGRNQLKRLDANNEKRRHNFALFLENLDPNKYRTDFDLEGSCNYAFNLILREPDDALCRRVMETLRHHRIEFRRGSAGGGNQLRQPYLRERVGDIDFGSYPAVEHIHFYGFYLGNYPGLPDEDIVDLTRLLNEI